VRIFSFDSFASSSALRFDNLVLLQGKSCGNKNIRRGGTRAGKTFLPESSSGIQAVRLNGDSFTSPDIVLVLVAGFTIHATRANGEKVIEVNVSGIHCSSNSSTIVGIVSRSPSAGINIRSTKPEWLRQPTIEGEF
jgi:hypothetical protein